MAPQYRPVLPLRIVTQRLAATEVKDLPRFTPELSGLVASSKDSFPESKIPEASKAVPDFEVLLHKFKTQLSSLLQDRSSSARWTAVVLIKTYVGVGGHAAIQSSGAWVRSMTGLLGVSGTGSSFEDASDCD